MVSLFVGQSACLLVTFLSPAKTDELIEMPFGMVSRVSPMSHVFAGVQILQETWQF